MEINMHSKLFAIMVLLSCYTSAGAGSDPVAEIAQCQNRVDSQFPSKEGVRVKRGEMLRDCYRVSVGYQPVMEEYWAYFIYMASEIDAGKVSVEQGQYLVTKKKNELLGPAITAAQQQEQQQQQQRLDYWQRQANKPTYKTNCSTIGATANCTTTRTDGY
jgi:hypothetical protein